MIAPLVRIGRTILEALQIVFFLSLYLVPVGLFFADLSRPEWFGRVERGAASAVSVAAASVAWRHLFVLRRRRKRLIEHGRDTDATVVATATRWVNVPYGYTGWVSSVTAEFMDGSGARARATYTDYGRGNWREGETIRIRYDPRDPTVINVAGSGGDLVDPGGNRSFEAYAMALPAAVLLVGIGAYFGCRAIG